MSLRWMSACRSYEIQPAVAPERAGSLDEFARIRGSLQRIGMVHCNILRIYDRTPGLLCMAVRSSSHRGKC